MICTLSTGVPKEVLTYSWVGNQCLYVCSLGVQIFLLLLQLPRQLCEETAMMTVKTERGRKILQHCDHSPVILSGSSAVAISSLRVLSSSCRLITFRTDPENRGNITAALKQTARWETVRWNVTYWVLLRSFQFRSILWPSAQIQSLRLMEVHTEPKSELKIKPESPEPLAEVTFTTHAHISPQVQSIRHSLLAASSAALSHIKRKHHLESARLTLCFQVFYLWE